MMRSIYKKYYRKYAQKMGIDKAIGYNILTRGFQLFSGAFTIYFTTKFLTPDELGYNYTFQSVLALQIFFELGFGGIITQFVAHEHAHLSWNENKLLIGSEYHLSRVSSILHLCIKWFGFLSGFLFIFLWITGYYYFSADTFKYKVSWFLPWTILCFSTSINFILSPLLSIYEGIGKVKDVAKMRFIIQVASIFSIIILLVLNFRLMAPSLASVLSILILIVGFKKAFPLFKDIWFKLKSFKINYKKEIFPLQWKIALSWISGYFIFQLFVPVTFKIDGAEMAGKLGLTLTVLNAILAISLSWFSTKIPLFSSLISLKNYNELDKIFIKTLKHSSFICILGILAFIVGLYLMQYFNLRMGKRFLPFHLIFFLSVCIFITQFIGGLATYLRCHKKEPYMWNSIIAAILVSVSTFYLGNFYGIKGIIYGYFFINIFYSVPISVYIFKTKKKEWHSI